jgi:hypothetical protein
MRSGNSADVFCPDFYLLAWPTDVTAELDQMCEAGRASFREGFDFGLDPSFDVTGRDGRTAHFVKVGREGGSLPSHTLQRVRDRLAWLQLRWLGFVGFQFLATVRPKIVLTSSDKLEQTAAFLSGGVALLCDRREARFGLIKLTLRVDDGRVVGGVGPVQARPHCCHRVCEVGEAL